jgi:hypothetical protein
MRGKKKASNMDSFNDFLEKNKDKIRKIAESNTKRNQNGVPVITKDDPWRKETSFLLYLHFKNSKQKARRFIHGL